MELSDGYHDVPPGRLAAVQTFLEMRRRPPLRPSRGEPSWRVERLAPVDLSRYYPLFHRVGDEHLWTLRLLLPRDEVAELLSDPLYETYVLVTAAGDEGLLELDFRVAGECEVSLFGVAGSLIGSGAGRLLMNHAITEAWSHPIERFWLHTCTLDHPKAIAFYERSGFVAYKRAIEVFPDPRMLGLTRKDAAATVSMF